MNVANTISSSLYSTAILIACTLLHGACVLEAGLGKSEAAVDAMADGDTDAPQTTAEICDDTEDNDGDSFIDCQDSDCTSSPACNDGRLSIFVTSRSYPPTFEGVGDGSATVAEQRADNICNHHAQEAGLLGDFSAWVGSLARKPTDIITSSGPWVNTDNETVFDARTGTDNSLDKLPLNPVSFDENAEDPTSNNFWTGTRVGGTAVTARNCLDWTSKSTGAEGLVGDIRYTDYRWTGAPASGVQAVYYECDVILLPILCIEI